MHPVETAFLSVDAPQDRCHRNRGDRGELLGLRWSDIDLDKKTLIVQHNLVIADGKVYEKEPKSESGKREIPLADALVQVLKEARDKDIEAFDEDYASTGYVIHQPDGDPYRPDSISQKWARFAKSNGIRYLSLHDIRHTVASQMIHKNVNCKVVQAIMGHADYKGNAGYLRTSLQRGRKGSDRRIVRSHLYRHSRGRIQAGSPADG